MNKSADDSGVSPVVGVILVVAVTVVLSAAIGAFVLNLGQSTSNPAAADSLGVRTSYADGGTATIQVVSGDADRLIVYVNGDEAASESTPSPGTSIEVSATRDDSISVVSETDGERSVISTTGSSTGSMSVPTAPSEGLIAHWTLDGDGSDTWVSNNGATFEDGVENQSAYFDGSSYIATGESLEPQEFTASFWMKADSLDGSIQRPLTQDITGSNYGWLFISSSSNELYFALQDASQGDPGITASGLEDDRWYHVVGVLGNGNLTLYVNNTQVAQTSASADWDTSSSEEIGIGGPVTDSQHFHGNVDDVRIYDRALDEGEIGDIYNATK